MALSIGRNVLLSQLKRYQNVRFIQSATSLVDVKLDESKGYAVVSMKNPPVNSLSLEMIQSMSEALADLEKKKCKGFILTSSSPTVFCAGLDIREMYKPKDDRLKTFWTSLQSLWMQLYGSKMASVALINGHSPAGGCLLAMTCDYRVMVDGKSKIGLNETKLGIVAPFWFKDSMLNTIGQRQTEMALQLGTLFSVEEAHKIGLIDKVVPDVQSATATAETQLQEFLKIPSLARYLSKMVVREATLKRLAENRDADLKQFVTFATSPQVQTGLGMYLESLKKKA